MSATTDTDDLRAHAAAIAANADLSATEITESIAAGLVELYSGRVTSANVSEDDETITITFEKKPGAFDEDGGDPEDVANAAPYQDYEGYLRANSDRLEPEPSSDEPTNTYSAWLAAREGE